MLRKRRNPKIALIAGMVLILTVLHYGTPDVWSHRHILLRELYFVPIVLAAFWFGLRGALSTSLASTLAFLPFVIESWQNFSTADLDRVLALALFNAMGMVLGILRNREQRRQQKSLKDQGLIALGEAVASIAHDMRNPLVTIGGFSHILQRKLDPESPLQAKLKIICDETKRLETMVKDMLDFSRPHQVRTEWTDLNRMLREVCGSTREEAIRKSVSIETELADTLPSCRIDRTLLRRAFINLMTNSVQASPEGGRVRICTCRQDRNVVVDFIDTGDGIPDVYRSRVFAPFFTTKQGGTGLGLAIVRRIVDAHGGSVEILDNPQAGTIFRIHVPCDFPEA